MSGLPVRGTAAVYMPPCTAPGKRGSTTAKMRRRGRFAGCSSTHVFWRIPAKGIAICSTASGVVYAGETPCTGRPRAAGPVGSARWSEANGHGWSQRSQQFPGHAAADRASRFLRRRLRRSAAPRARDRADAAQARAQKCEDARVLLPENEKLLHDTGLFRYHQPKPASAAWSCPTSPWSTSSPSWRAAAPRRRGTSATLAAITGSLGYYEPEDAARVWDADPDALIASSIALAAGRGKKVSGGFQVSGRLPVRIRRWTTAAGTCSRSPSTRTNESPGRLAGSASCRRATTASSTPGTRWAWSATGSKDIEVKDVFVPERRALEAEEVPRRAEHPGAKLNDGRPVPHPDRRRGRASPVGHPHWARPRARVSTWCKSSR